MRARAEEDALAARSSLKLYASLGHRAADGVAKYLSDCYNRRGVRLMTKFRLGYLYNMETVAKLLHWPRAGATCVMCDSGETEDVTHMLLSCPYLEGCRSRLEAELLARLPAAGVPGDELLAQYAAGGSARVRLLLGAATPTVTPGMSDEQREYCGLALWTVDKAAKKILAACWRMREAQLGELRVEHSKLVHEPSKMLPDEVSRLEAALSAGPLYGPPAVEYRAFWLDWIPGERAKQSRPPRTRRRAAFFAVWAGRQTGVCYGWSECMPWVANHPGAAFKGFETLQEAESAFARGLPGHS